MGLIQSLAKEKQESNGFFAAVGGERLSGKSTIAGTLPGKTLLVQPQGIEAGNLSPVVLAKELGNDLQIVEVPTYKMFFDILQDDDIKSFDNVYIDGASALSEQIYQSPEFKKASAANKWAGFDLIKDTMLKYITALKNYAYNNNKNVFVTFATEVVRNAEGAPMEIKTVAKGNFPKRFVESASGQVVQTVINHKDDGTTSRALITSTTGPYHARLGDLLDGQAPKAIKADLKELLKIVGRI